jgi:hypothetical protein
MAAPVHHSVAFSAAQALPDKRRNDRLATHVPIRIVSLGGSRVSLDGVCTDISISGLGLDTAAVLQVGDIVEFEFVQADDMPLRYRARILYRVGNHYGAYYLEAE